jgi:preprotein translocase subunit YajC
MQVKGRALFMALAWAFVLIGLAGCVPDGGAPAEGQGGGMAQMIMIMAIFIAIFYFLLIRPQRKRQKEHSQLLEELRKGDKVITSSGIYGTIENIGKDSIVLRVESGATLRVTRDSIGGKRGR